VAKEQWAVADAYEAYIGRWSRQVAVAFVRWLDVPPGLRWLDVGCGTGALTSAVVANADPESVVGVDPSGAFLVQARTTIPGVTFHQGDARELPLFDDDVDVVVSGLTLNFVPEPAHAVAEFTRVAKPGGTVAAYVWDYGDGMEMIRYLFDAATTLDPGAAELDEGRRFPLCRAEALEQLWSEHGLAAVAVEPIEVPTTFRDFDDYWSPFLGGQGPAPGYVMSLPEERRADLRELLRSRLPAKADASIPLTARAWAVRGEVTAPA
jgi:SAM-dependent methyltransferase